MFMGRVMTPVQYLWSRLAIDVVMGWFGGTGIDVLAQIAGAAIGFNFDLFRKNAVQMAFR
jgi:hypothetical protein